MNARCSTGKACNIAASVGVSRAVAKEEHSSPVHWHCYLQPVIFEVLTALLFGVCVREMLHFSFMFVFHKKKCWLFL